tara:strand:+ start:34539 stop:36500 length:1962 start_codon:yes stop_codon:yes gene_type:complete
MNRLNNTSDYWIGNLTGSSDMWWREEEITKGRDLVQLASYRSAISNYVNIVTGRTDIPVTYNSKDESYTDGKKVYLSGNMDSKNFDPNVGLALHEGSHIVHSDFELLKTVPTLVGERYEDVYGEIAKKIKNLLNYIEDRRIDFQVFKSAPGYQNYYHAMYNKYFNFKVIDKALKSNEHRESTWESYEFRIMNFTNKNTDLDALPELRKIYRTIDLKNISRLKSTEDALNVAFEVYDIIMANIVTSKESEEEESESKNGSDSSSDSNGEGSKVDTGNKEMKADGKPAPSKDMPELTPSQQRSLQNAIKKQKQLIDGETKKVKLTKSEKSTISTVESSGAYTKEVGTGTYQKTNCVILPRLTQAMFNENMDWEERKLYPFVDTWAMRSGEPTRTQTAITDGIRLGRILGKKLQVRNEERTTKWSRQDSGRLDKRIIAELGFNNDRVFKTTLTERYNDAFIHISIDGSGSMDGAKFDNALKSTAAICQAASMAGNIHVQVTYRSTIHMKNHGSPMLVVLYDSKVNKMVHIKKYWGMLKTSGTTPEGLCFEAISQEIINTAAGRDAYFLNYSDGMPWFSNKTMDYSGNSALSHTKEQVNNFRKNGINILSFFIEDSEWSRERTNKDFKRMYGQDASMIDSTKVVALAKELNKKFLQK